ncbi:uncharacterized protein BJ171DRAFT_460857 [Polychytrium aggregatum]|uniref:uncharacterized protein n=1 Tax=Polychytrium aggregatum TaxID=110093 RepID=UPI0022FF2DB8|nr:uncharacterized protein BJ171DRAFT_460857 [Polychytrium aggregatum]KAI9203058.1 hypothetical protein BJ171DRAFT_460857 [Polychytrium aggregatum]
MSADELKSLGNKAFSAKDYTTAIGHFSKAIEIDASNHVLYSNRSASYASLKQYTEALADAEKAVALKPDWAKGYSRKGVALFGLGKHSDAAEAYQAGLKIEPENAALKQGLEDVENAMANEGLGGLGKLFGPDVWTKIASNPKLSPLLAQTDIVQKIKDIQANPSAINMYMQDPRMMTLLMGLMGLDANVATADADEAPAVVPEPAPAAPAASSAPKQTPVPVAKEEIPEVEMDDEETQKKRKRAESDKHKDLGNAEYKKRNFEAALKHYDEAWKADETNVAVLTNKSAVLFEIGKYQETITICEQAIETGRDLRVDYKLIARAFARIATSHHKLGNLELAIKNYNHSLAEHRTPDTLNKLRELEKEKKEADRLAYRDPKLSDEARERGNELFKNSKFSEAIKEYTEAIKRNDQDPRNFSNRAACYTKLMALSEAEKDCDAAIKLDPSFVKAYIRKAAILFTKREYTKCIDLCNEAKERDTEQKHTEEIENQINRCMFSLNQIQQGDDTETQKRAMQDPEVQEILADPVMQTILQQMQQDPRAANDHMKNPAIASKIRTLINAGIIRVGR